MGKRSKRKKKLNKLRADLDKEYLFVIPDINGEIHMLDKMLEMINAGKEWPLASSDTVIFTGQYMGPYTKQTIEAIRDFQKKADCEVKVLTGPDDYRFMKMRKAFLESERGKQAINSYRNHFPLNRNISRENSLDLESMMEDRNWLAQLHSFYLTDNVFVCYGGIDPSKSIADQNVGALMFNAMDPSVAPKFQEHTEDFERIIIHSGFTTKAKPFIKKSKTGKINRINVNTDALKTGFLSCSVINAKTGELVKTINVYDKTRYPAWQESVKEATN